MKSYLSLGVLALLLVGCNKPSKPPIEDDEYSQQVAANSGTAPNSEESTTPETATKPEPGPPKIKPEDIPKPGPKPAIAPLKENTKSDRVAGDGHKQEKPFAVPGAGTDGWKGSQLTALDLGNRMDVALLGLKGAYSEATTFLRDHEMEGKTPTKLSIQDDENYKIEYPNPSHPTEAYILIGNKGARARMVESKWQSDDFIAGNPGAIKDWLENPVGQIFNGFAQQKPLWAKLLSEFVGRGEGFSTVIEQKEMSVNGKPRMFYRLLAERKGNLPATVEVRIDGLRQLPVTIRVNRKIDAKKESFLQWNAGWTFEKPIDPGTFAIPSHVQ